MTFGYSSSAIFQPKRHYSHRFLFVVDKEWILAGQARFSRFRRCSGFFHPCPRPWNVPMENVSGRRRPREQQVPLSRSSFSIWFTISHSSLSLLLDGRLSSLRIGTIDFMQRAVSRRVTPRKVVGILASYLLWKGWEREREREREMFCWRMVHDACQRRDLKCFFFLGTLRFIIDDCCTRVADFKIVDNSKFYNFTILEL